ncbi:hypothetical protein N781_03070 [Pontibacillus halophilus JSM 076056 = DSM 19796]|uniref:Uncharacterized protein n=1 Tax=Pontibacillus halophilus JSM 076056 = DSM 19796 TaxID=1385510 RepID=A0A0A5I8C4_9BACI|nr:hypothetical protein [Pontibacillus halophilus]KGX92082.1 hypothetical protein N781_03070 [Pontibacillus halophilus JSM 076056 = DSM 19796]
MSDRYNSRRDSNCTIACDIASLARFIEDNFCCADTIGLTFIEQGTASIATGQYVEVRDAVVVVKNLLRENTTSYVPLSKVDSVEKGPGLDTPIPAPSTTEE